MSSLSKGQMKIVILDDGTIKSETSDMSGASHKAADDFLNSIYERDDHRTELLEVQPPCLWMLANLRLLGTT